MKCAYCDERVMASGSHGPSDRGRGVTVIGVIKWWLWALSPGMEVSEGEQGIFAFSSPSVLQDCLLEGDICLLLAREYSRNRTWAGLKPTGSLLVPVSWSVAKATPKSGSPWSSDECGSEWIWKLGHLVSPRGASSWLVMGPGLSAGKAPPCLQQTCG